MKRLLATTLFAVLVLAGCSSGADTSGDKGASAGSGDTISSGGLPEVSQPQQVHDLVHETMKGKRVAFIPILYKGYKITEEWGIQMQRAFDNLGVDFQVYDSNFDTDQMVRTIDDLIRGKKADVLIFQSPDVNLLSQQVKAAHDAGIYVIVLNMTSNQSGDAFIGADLFSAAKEITGRVAEDCKATGKTKVALVNGPANDPWAVLYRSGVEEAAGELGLEIVDVTDSKWQADLANQQAATLLQRHGADLCALMLPWDVLAIPATQAVKAAEQAGTIKAGAVGVYAIDASDDGCDAIRSGAIRATVAYDQDAIGAGAAFAAQQLLELGNTPGSQRTASFVPHQLLDKSNVDSVTFACYSGQS